MDEPLVPKSFLRYGIVGIGSNLLVYCIFLAFIWTGVPAVSAAAICYGIGLAVSYVFNRRWSFESTASHGSDLVRFLIAYGLGFVATLLFITVLTVFLGPETAQILNIGLTALVIYTCLRVSDFGNGDR